MPFIPPALINCYINVSRPRYNSTTKATSTPKPNISMVPANIQPLSATDYILLGQAPEPALRANYVIEIGAGWDIVVGDLITDIFKLDKRTTYEGSGPQLGDAGAGNVVWWVRYMEDNEPGFIQTRSLYVERTVVGGPAA